MLTFARGYLSEQEWDVEVKTLPYVQAKKQNAKSFLFPGEPYAIKLVASQSQFEDSGGALGMRYFFAVVRY